MAVPCLLPTIALGCEQKGPTSLDVKCLIEIATGAKFQCRGASPVSARFRRCDDAEFELLIRTTKCP